MTITFPRDLPGFAWATANFELAYFQVSSPTRGGLVQVANVARERWQAQYQTVPLDETDLGVWRAWLASLRGGARLFRAYDPMRPWPISYPGGVTHLTRAGGGSFDGTAAFVSAGTQLDTLTINTLPPSFVLLPGDMLSIAYATGHVGLHRIIEGGTASAGGSITLTVEPTLVPGAEAGDAVRLVEAYCTAVLMAGSVTVQAQARRHGSVKFSAMQSF